MASNLNADQFISNFNKHIKIVEPELASGYDKVKDKIFIQKDIAHSYLYYRTIFHELVHWTGHHTRLDRDYVFLTEREREIGYVREEVIAEMGSKYLCNRFDIFVPFADVAEYLNPYIAHIQQFQPTKLREEIDRAQPDIRHAINYLSDYIETMEIVHD